MERKAFRKKAPNAGYLLSRLDMYAHLPPEAVAELQYAIHVANEAIHGDEVSGMQAELAILRGATGLEKLQKAGIFEPQQRPAA